MPRVPEHRRTAVALLISALAGCALVRPPPANDLRQEALNGIRVDQPWKAGSADTAGPPPDNWLATFDDSQLGALAAEAIARNPDLRVAATRVEQAALYVDLAKAQLKPSFSIAGTTGFKVSDLSSALTGIIALISWELDLWGRFRYAREAADATYGASRADFEFARQSLAANTAKSWFTATETLLQQQLVADTVRAGEDLVGFADQRIKVGVGDEQDVVLARASLGIQQDQLRQAVLAHQQALRAL